MAREVNYRQCKLQKKTANGTMEQTSYIPEPFCQVGRILKLREDDGTWNDGWKVIFASSMSHSEKWVNQQSHAHTKNRMETDI